MTFLPIALALLMQVNGVAAQQPASSPASPFANQPKCTVEGVVINDGNATPLRKANVRLMGNGVANFGGGGNFGGAVGNAAPMQPQSQVTDAEGRFSFANVNCGRLQIMVDHPSFVARNGNRFARGRATPVELSAGQKVSDLVLHVSPAAVIRGRVLDEDGDPRPNAMVHTLQEMYVRGRKQRRPTSAVQTDDRGEFRLHGLVPGRYYVLANYRNERGPQQEGQPADPAKPRMAYVPTYYPGASDREHASPLELHAGDEVPIDIMLTRTVTAPVRGSVARVGGKVPTRAQVMAAPVDGVGFGM